MLDDKVRPYVGRTTCRCRTDPRLLLTPATTAVRVFNERDPDLPR